VGIAGSRRPQPLNHRALSLLGVLGIGACSSVSFVTDDATDGSALSVRLEVVASGLESPVSLTAPIADPRLFVVEQRGRIRVIRGGSLLATPFLDITDRVRFEGDQGLLGLAFDPDFRANGRFFVSYTGLDGATRVESYLDIDRSDRADASSSKLFLEIEQPFPDHNGGPIAFGPDNLLYVALGDGGGSADPEGQGQDPSTLLGSILRLEVLDQIEPPYRIPTDNPFVGDPSGRPEIWHFGLRAPQNISFDPDQGVLYVTDRGQSRWEEINAMPLDLGGENLGWSVLEGSECFGGVSCQAEGFRLPVAVYSHDDGCSITGGYVYGGRAAPSLLGRYVYADRCVGWLRAFTLGADGVARDPVELDIEPPGMITAFGLDAQGEMYLATEGGRILKFVSGG
jgi:glucose/arabinose dehydrogenase